MQMIVNVSDAKASKGVGDTLVTYSLGSCIGVMAHDPFIGAAGLLHFQLPNASMDPERAKRQPAMFADSGLEHLFRMLETLGASRKRLKIKIAGGAKMFEDKGGFDIGKRNHTAVRKWLWQMGLLLEREDCGGTSPRTVFFDVNDGKVTLKRNDGTVQL
jgi:chemotaxis protein CheD